MDQIDQITLKMLEPPNITEVVELGRWICYLQLVAFYEYVRKHKRVELDLENPPPNYEFRKCLVKSEIEECDDCKRKSECWLWNKIDFSDMKLILLVLSCMSTRKLKT